MNRKYAQLEEKIEYYFNDKALLLNALTHTSFANEHKNSQTKDNERLEFLGDAVLELVSSDFLYLSFPQMPEGEMTKLRASLVCEPTLAMDARYIGLEEYIYLGKGEGVTGGRYRDSIVSDAFEALIGAIYLDGGLEKARRFILKFALNDIDNKKIFHDSKTILQERVSSTKGNTLTYQIVSESGPDHNKTYEAVVKVNNQVVGSGIGHTKKAAEQQAAYCALKTLDKRK